MQQLETRKEIVEAEQQYKRMGKGRCIALSRRIYRLMQTDVFYVESESTDNVYYFVKFKPDVVEYCTCPDNSLRGGQMKCKHLTFNRICNKIRNPKRHRQITNRG